MQPVFRATVTRDPAIRVARVAPVTLIRRPEQATTSTIAIVCGVKGCILKLSSIFEFALLCCWLVFLGSEPVNQRDNSINLPCSS